jgi:hypothetical protein
VPHQPIEDDHAKHSLSRFVTFQDYRESAVQYHREPAYHADPTELLHREPDLPRTSRCIELDEIADLTYGQTPCTDQDGVEVYPRSFLQGGEETNSKSQGRPDRHGPERDEETTRVVSKYSERVTYVKTYCVMSTPLIRKKVVGAPIVRMVTVRLVR